MRRSKNELAASVTILGAALLLAPATVRAEEQRPSHDDPQVSHTNQDGMPPPPGGIYGSPIGDGDILFTNVTPNTKRGEGTPLKSADDLDVILPPFGIAGIVTPPDPEPPQDLLGDAVPPLIDFAPMPNLGLGLFVLPLPTSDPFGAARRFGGLRGLGL